MNHEEIAEAFRSLGCSVFDTADLGGGFPDLVVGLIGVNLLVEVKTDDGSLEPAQVRFVDEWRGQYEIVRSVDGAVQLVHSTRRNARVAPIRG